MPKLFNDDDEINDLEEVIIPDDDPLKPFLEKYKDPNGVAKALVEKDKFINRLQRENAETRAELLARARLEDTVDRLLTNQNNVSVPPVGTPPADPQNNGNPTPTPGLSLQDVEKLLEKKEVEVQSKNNLDYSKRELEKVYGKDWKAVLQKKAGELGESLDFFDALAKTKPNVLFALLGKTETKPQAPSLFSPSVNTTAQTLGTSADNNQRTQSFYDRIKKADPVAYRSPKVQNQMHKDALALREAFFDV